MRNERQTPQQRSKPKDSSPTRTTRSNSRRKASRSRSVTPRNIRLPESSQTTPPQFSTTLERVLWEQLQAANEHIARLHSQLGMVLDRQFYRPVTHPRTDLTPEASTVDVDTLSGTGDFDEKSDQAEVDADIKRQTAADLALSEQLREEFEEIAREQEEAHAEA